MNSLVHDDGGECVRSANGKNNARLVAIKAYDPTNFFRMSQNIAPAG